MATEAKRSAKRRIKQLKRQKLEWFAENAQDQGEYLRLLKLETAKEEEIQAATEDLLAIRSQLQAKAQEMVGENKTQLAKFDQLIKEAEETYQNI